MVPDILRAMMAPDQLRLLGRARSGVFRKWLLVLSCCVVLHSLCRFQEVLYPVEVVKRSVLLLPGFAYTPVLLAVVILFLCLIFLVAKISNEEVAIAGMRSGTYGLILVMWTHFVWIVWNTFAPWMQSSHFGIPSRQNQVTSGVSRSTFLVDAVSILMMGLPLLVMIVCLVYLPARAMFTLCKKDSDKG
jgi:hypothetical protein